MEIKPFRGFRFNPKVVGDVGKCIAPPFDVIDPDQQQQLYEKSEYNIVHITKGKTTPSDNEHNNQYTRAAEYLNLWIKNGVLKQDAKEAIYAYVQDFQLAGFSYQRLSFIALTKLEEFGPLVRPHEQVFEKQLTDRLNLYRATAARFGLVFMLYEDKQKLAEKIIAEKFSAQKPRIDFVTPDLIGSENIRQRLYAINGRADIDAMVTLMSDKSCIIADGHHRYTTGLIYSKESDNPAAKYQMLSFTNIYQEGLKLLATHRIISNLENFATEKLITSLKEKFEVTKLPFDSPGAKKDAKQKMIAQMKSEYNSDGTAFGIYGVSSRRPAARSNAFYIAVLKNKRSVASASPDKSGIRKPVDVSILHELILEKILGIDEQKLTNGEFVEFVKGTPNAIDDSIRLVDNGQKQVLFLVNPVKMQQLQEVTADGERMPHKSTYFFPKMYTGLVIQKL
ncbi:MAG: DUF1015 domain-containing protein [Sedimentisphaerales bacterium]|jgi:uncharacterized protein (DUF1015 family)|nr:DUF1015 domain-containing protein [Sedimentisphaerales bacterium]